MKIGKMKICIIIAQFGKLTPNFDLWLKSCAYNKEINFLVWSDIKKDSLPENVTWINRSFSEFRELAKNKLQMEIYLEEPYDCCEFKTVYGVIFEDYLKDFEYWGYCDMDMIFGDLEYFFTKYEYHKYDKFFSRGHLTLYRNTQENNNRYKLPATPGKDYITALTKKGITHFDEDEINTIYKVYGFPFFAHAPCADISRDFSRARISGEYDDYKLQAFFWQRGKVFRAYYHANKLNTIRQIDLEEFAYIHFSRRKMEIPQFDIDKTDAYYICPDSFKVKNHLGSPSKNEIKSVNPYHGVSEKFEWFKYAFKRLKLHLHEGK